MFESAEIHHAFVQRVLAGVAERRMAEIMRETDGLGQILVQLQGVRNGARDLRDFDGVREPGSIQVAFVIDEHLGLVDQAAEGGGMHDAVAVALVFRTICRLRFSIAPAARMLIVGRIGRQRGQSKNSASVASSAPPG